MNNHKSLELIGLVAKEIIRHKFYDFEDRSKSAMVRFDSLDKDVLLACVNTICKLNECNLNPDGIEIKIPSATIFHVPLSLSYREDSVRD